MIFSNFVSQKPIVFDSMGIYYYCIPIDYLPRLLVVECEGKDDVPSELHQLLCQLGSKTEPKDTRERKDSTNNR